MEYQKIFPTGDNEHTTNKILWDVIKIVVRGDNAFTCLLEKEKLKNW